MSAARSAAKFSDHTASGSNAPGWSTSRLPPLVMPAPPLFGDPHGIAPVPHIVECRRADLAPSLGEGTRNGEAGPLLMGETRCPTAPDGSAVPYRPRRRQTPIGKRRPVCSEE